ncbi:uncharacterized protein LOC131439514 [Malaya genurostris]|uniref:uncharacterized protein LOC131439514 n=1 Tax=Malaya genurostris TaxID=325434 RepID=UPI0026F38CBE|nr:uncharacterized protein LOC131439514 [Malaya genurostris]
MSEKRQFTRYSVVTIVFLQLVISQSVNSAKVDKVVVVMPKGPRTLQMLGSISPQLLHTISDVLKPVPSNVIQIPVPYYPDAIKSLKGKRHKHGTSKALHHAYFNNPFSQSVSFSLDLKNTQPGPYDTPFTPVLKPSPVNPIRVENPPDLQFTPINLLPLEPPSFDTIRNYVQKLKVKQKAFFDSQGYDFGLSVVPPVKHYDYPKKKRYKHKYSKPSYEYLFSSHPNELTHIGQANLSPAEETVNVYFTESNAGQSSHSNNAEGHEFVIPPDADFNPALPLGGIVDPEDAHFEQKGEDLVLKTKHPHAAVVTPEELEYFTHHTQKEHGFASKQTKNEFGSSNLNSVHHRDKRYKNDRLGRSDGSFNVDADFYDSDELKKALSDDDFYDVDEVKAHQSFEPKKTYSQVRHQVTTRKGSQPSDDSPRIREKITISKTNIVYSEQGQESNKFDHKEEGSSGQFHSKAKKPKKYRRKREVSNEPVPEETDEASVSEEHESDELYEEFNSKENEVDYELEPMDSTTQNDTETLLLPYAQALVFQNDTDTIWLPLPEALVDPRELQGQELLNFLDEAIRNSTKYLPKEKKKKRIKISPDIKRLQGQELIQFLDDAIKVSNQYLVGDSIVSGSGDAIELVNPPQFNSSEGVPGNATVTNQEQQQRNHQGIQFKEDAARAEQIHGDVRQYTRNHRLDDVPHNFEAVNFVRPLNTLLHLQKDAQSNDYEIEFEQDTEPDPKELHGEELLRYMDKIIAGTSVHIPKRFEHRNFTSPYLDRAFHYMDIDTALKYADNVSDHISDYLTARELDKQKKDQDQEPLLLSESGFVPVRSPHAVESNTKYSSSKHPAFVGVPLDAYKNSHQKQSNPAVVVYNDVIRHIKNHLSSSEKSKSKDRHMLMIAVPRSLRENHSEESQRRIDFGYDNFPRAKVFSLPIFDITKFYPSANLATYHNEDDQTDLEFDPSKQVKDIIEKEAERLVESSNQSTGTKQSQISKTGITEHERDDISDAFGGVPYKKPHVNQNIPIKPYAVKEKFRDSPQPTFKKPGPPYAALPVPPSNTKTKVAALNTVPKKRTVNHPPPPHLTLKRKRHPQHYRKSVKRVPLRRKTVRIIKRH